QQLEGMFKRNDIKVHANMSKELQKSRIILSGPGNENVEITQEKLRKVHQHFKKKEKVGNENERSMSRKEMANAILSSFLSR
ncbi:9546_t:CDS:1, partial [Funneliformis mosseae]